MMRTGFRMGNGDTPQRGVSPNIYQKNYFNFKKLNNNYLITNDFGNYYFLSDTDGLRMRKKI